MKPLAILAACLVASGVCAAGWSPVWPLATNTTTWEMIVDPADNPMQQLWNAAEERRIVGEGDGVGNTIIQITKRIDIDIGRTSVVFAVTNSAGNVKTLTNFTDVIITVTNTYLPQPWATTNLATVIYTNLAGEVKTNHTPLQYRNTSPGVGLQDTPVFPAIQNSLFYEAEDGAGDASKAEFFVRTNWARASFDFTISWFQGVTNAAGGYPNGAFPMHFRDSLFLGAKVGTLRNTTTGATWFIAGQGQLPGQRIGSSFYTMITNTPFNWLLGEAHWTNNVAGTNGTNIGQWGFVTSGVSWHRNYAMHDETIRPVLRFTGTNPGAMTVSGQAFVYPYATNAIPLFNDGHNPFTLVTTNETVTIAGSGDVQLAGSYHSINSITGNVAGTTGDVFAVLWTNNMDLYGAGLQQMPYIATPAFDDLKRILDVMVWTRDREAGWIGDTSIPFNQFLFVGTSDVSWAQAKAAAEASTPIQTSNTKPPRKWSWGQTLVSFFFVTNAVFTNPPGQKFTSQTWQAKLMATQSRARGRSFGGTNFASHSEYYARGNANETNTAPTSMPASVVIYSGGPSNIWHKLVASSVNGATDWATSSIVGDLIPRTSDWVAPPVLGTNRARGYTYAGPSVLFRWDVTNGFTYHNTF